MTSKNIRNYTLGKEQNIFLD